MTSVELVTTADWTSAHLPDRAVPAEAAFAAANDRGRDGALSVLSDLLPDLPIAELSQTTDAATFKVGRAAPELEHLLDVEETLDHLLTWSDLHGQQLLLVREQERPNQGLFVSQTAPGGRMRARVAAIAAFMRDGFTLVFNGVELRDASSMRLAEAAERIFGTVVNINGYLSLRPSMSFGAHWDDQETIILQLLGRKTWILEEPRALSMAHDVHGGQTSGRTVWQGTLDPGASLYVPRGWGHRVHSIDELTYHYTVTMPRTNGTRLVETILEQRAPKETSFRNLPMSAGSDGFEGLGVRADEEVVRSALALRRLAIPSRSTQRLSVLRQVMGGATEGVSVRCPLPGGWVMGPSDSDSRLVAGSSGLQLSIARTDVERVAAWTDGLSHAWPADGEDDALVRQLLAVGFLDASIGGAEPSGRFMSFPAAPRYPGERSGV